MKFGIILPTFGAGAGRLAMVDTLRAAESLGFESAWTTDHLALSEGEAEPFSPIFEAISTLAYLAGCSNRIRLGVSALTLPQRNAVEVGKTLASLDVLSGGRLMAVIGLGASREEFENLGYSFPDRGKRMEEGLKVLRTLWRGGRYVSFSGTYYQFSKVDIAPTPLQPGGPPLLVAGNSPAALRAAVMLADGWQADDHTPESLAGALASARPLLANRPFMVMMRGDLAFSDGPRADVRFSGSADEIALQLRAYAQAGVETMLLHFQAKTQAERERAMHRFIDKIVPQLV